MNSRLFNGFLACVLTFLALCAGAPAQAANAFDNASIEITWVDNDTDGGKHCYNFLVGYKITGVTPGFVYHQNAVRVQQGSVINDFFVDDSIHGSNFPDPADGWMEFYGYKNAASQAICDVLENKPFTVSVRACATPDRNPANCVWIESAPVVVNRWRGPTSELTLAPVGTATPTSATISASGNACADASLHIALDGLTPDSGYPFSALDATLTQGSSTGTLQRMDWWLVMADGAGHYEGDVPLSSFSPASGITCADLAAGTPFDVTVTATLPGGASVSSTTTHQWPQTPTSTPTPEPGQPPRFRVNIDNSSPTLGDIGLLLSGIALAGAAAPALRRRERRYTHKQ